MQSEPQHYDVLIVGAGNAACCAAFAALDRKARVGLIEKAPKRDRGGNSALTAHMRFVYNGIDDLRPLVKNMSEAELQKQIDRLPHRTEAEVYDEFMRVTDNQVDEPMLQVHVREALNTVHWLAGKGHDWVPTGNVGDNILLMNGGGYGLQQRNFALLEKAGATFHYDTAATSLIQDATGRVVGVRALTPAGFTEFRAKAIVLACGGFESNAEMRARYLGKNWDTVKVRGVPFNTGDGLRMALDIGALPHGSWTSCHASPQDIAMSDSVLPSVYAVGASTVDETNRYMYPYSILVNVHGERFIDESSDTRGKTYAKMGGAILMQPGGIAFQIMDAKIRNRNLYFQSYSKATTAKANTLDALAEELGIDAAKLANTVATFNAAVLPGEFKPDRLRLDGKGTAGITPPKSNYALTIDEPPFEGWPVRCGITFTYGGLRIDPETAQVQHVAGRPIPGLYAAGEMVGGLFVGNYPSGSGMMAGAVFGRQAGIHAGKEAVA
jgi:tricarballylate dehydrogenase